MKLPSPRLLSRIADVLGLPKESLFVLAHPKASSLLGTPRNAAPRQKQDQAWQEFAGNEALSVRVRVPPPAPCFPNSQIDFVTSSISEKTRAADEKLREELHHADIDKLTSDRKR
jgi:hypothetical protein